MALGHDMPKVRAGAADGRGCLPGASDSFCSPPMHTRLQVLRLTNPGDNLYLEDSFGALYHLPRRLQVLSRKTSQPCLFPTKLRNDPEGAAAIGNHLVVALS